MKLTRALTMELISLMLQGEKLSLLPCEPSTENSYMRYLPPAASVGAQRKGAIQPKIRAPKARSTPTAWLACTSRVMRAAEIVANLVSSHQHVHCRGEPKGHDIELVVWGKRVQYPAGNKLSVGTVLPKLSDVVRPTL